MKGKLWVLLGVGWLLLWGGAAFVEGQVLITGFGEEIEPDFLLGTWQGNYDSLTSRVAGTARDNNTSGFSKVLEMPLDLSGHLFMRLQGENFYRVDTIKGFSLEMFDGAGRLAEAQFNDQDFLGGASVTALIQLERGFDLADVRKWIFTSNGVGDHSIDFRFDELAAVPEPRAMVLVVLGFAFIALLRRKSKAQRAAPER